MAAPGRVVVDAVEAGGAVAAEVSLQGCGFLGTLDPGVATPGQCGTSTGECTGVTEFPLPPPPSTCNSGHVSGLAVQGGSSSRIWLDDSLSSQVGAYKPASNQFALDTLSCGVHPHDGLNLDAAVPPHVWWDEEFANALGKLTQ